LRQEDVHNLSSDIIESTLGIFKSKKTPNKLCGDNGISFDMHEDIVKDISEFYIIGVIIKK